jgi:hypothetical protein
MRSRAVGWCYCKTSFSIWNFSPASAGLFICNATRYGGKGARRTSRLKRLDTSSCARARGVGDHKWGAWSGPIHVWTLPHVQRLVLMAEMQRASTLAEQGFGRWPHG